MSAKLRKPASKHKPAEAESGRKHLTQQLALRDEEMRETLRDSRSRRHQREAWSNRVFQLAVGWFILTALLVLASCVDPQFQLPDAAWVSLVGGGPIAGLLILIVRSLFPPSGR